MSVTILQGDRREVQVSEIMRRMVEIVAENVGITAGHAGAELWGTPSMCGRPENVRGTMFCRSAGKLLARAERLGLVRSEQHGPSKLWFARKPAAAPGVTQ